MRKIDELPDIDFIDGATIEDVKADLIKDNRERSVLVRGKPLYDDYKCRSIADISANAIR